MREEAGLEVLAKRIIAIQDRDLHNYPPYAYNICKVFVECDIIGGHFIQNLETTDSAFFGPDELPPLSIDKTTAEQVLLCLKAHHDNQWIVTFD